MTPIKMTTTMMSCTGRSRNCMAALTGTATRLHVTHANGSRNRCGNRLGINSAHAGPSVAAVVRRLWPREDAKDLGIPWLPLEVTTDRYRVYPLVLEEVVPAAFHDTEVHANNRLETDHGRLKARLRPMRGLKCDRTARVIITGHAFVQNLRRASTISGPMFPQVPALRKPSLNWPWRSDPSPEGSVHLALASDNATVPRNALYASRRRILLAAARNALSEVR